MTYTNVSFDNSHPIKINSTLNRRLITIYTAFLILKNMRDRLGIETMVDFLENYTKTIEHICPNIKEAVNDELLERALLDLHQTVCSNEK